MIESKDSGQPLPASYQIPIEKLGIQMVDERNKRGRPPKKPKLPEVETREKQLLQQKIMAQVEQGFQQQAKIEGLNLTFTTEQGSIQIAQMKVPDQQQSDE